MIIFKHSREKKNVDGESMTAISCEKENVQAESMAAISSIFNRFRNRNGMCNFICKSHPIIET